MTLIDLKDAFLSVPIHEDHRKFPMGGDTIQISVSSIQSHQCPLDFHKAHEASDGSPEEAGMHGFYRRLASSGPLQWRLLEKSGSCWMVPFQKITCLGLILDSVQMTLTLPEEQLAVIMEECAKDEHAHPLTHLQLHVGLLHTGS